MTDPSTAPLPTRKYVIMVFEADEDGGVLARALAGLEAVGTPPVLVEVNTAEDPWCARRAVVEAEDARESQ